MSIARGTLFVVGTPIGNLEDLSRRAAQVLDQVDVIAAEDTRHSRRLLDAYGVRTPMVAYHEHNEAEMAAALIERLSAGETVALISDAGTPLLSDPGYRLVRAAHQARIPVVSVPGPSAITSAMSISGLATDRFRFEGFLPTRGAARRERLRQLALEAVTLVFFESSHRIKAMVADLEAVFGADRPAALAREMTKIHESVVSGVVKDLGVYLEQDRSHCKGEFVVLTGGRVEEAVDESGLRRMLEVMLKELPAGTSASLVAKIAGCTRKRAYDLAVEISATRKEG